MLKDIRLTILDTLKANLPQVKTFFTGYPAYIQTQYTPFIGVFTENATIEWAMNRAYNSTYTLSIIIGVNAQQEAEKRNRGMADEDFLNDIVESIISILFTQLHKIGDATLKGPINVDYREGGGNIRYATISVVYNEIVVFNPQ